MTPEQLTGLGLLLIEFRDWLDDQDPGTLDRWLVDALIDVVAARRRALIADGAR